MRRQTCILFAIFLAICLQYLIIFGINYSSTFNENYKTKEQDEEKTKFIQQLKIMAEDTKQMVRASYKAENEDGIIRFVKASRDEISFFFGSFSQGLPHVLPFRHFYGKVEYSVLLALEHGWKSSKKEDTVFFDVGANSGWFTLHAAARGYNVYSFDVQPGCVRWIKAEVLLNGFNGLVEVFNNGVSSQKGYKIDVDGTTCNGGYSFDAKKNVERVEGNIVFVNTIQLDPVIETVGKDVIVKMDTEGSEVDILKTLMKSLKKKVIKSLVIEVVPTLWKLKGNSFEEGVQVFQEVLDAGYGMYVLYDPNNYGPKAAVPMETPSYIDQELDLWELVDLKEFMLDRYNIEGGGTNVWIYRIENKNN